MTKLQKSLVGGGVVVVLGVIVTASLLSRAKPKGEEVYMAKAEKRDVISVVTASGRVQPTMASPGWISIIKTCLWAAACNTTAGLHCAITVSIRGPSRISAMTGRMMSLYPSLINSCST